MAYYFVPKALGFSHKIGVDVFDAQLICRSYAAQVLNHDFPQNPIDMSRLTPFKPLNRCNKRQFRNDNKLRSCVRAFLRFMRKSLLKHSFAKVYRHLFRSRPTSTARICKFSVLAAIF
jgi:hypothetical protein